MQNRLKIFTGEWLEKNVLYLLIVLFLLVRLCILQSGIFYWHDEELYNGTITKEILSGMNLSLFDYQYTPHNGGTIVVGLLAVPFFILFGDSYFSLKLVAVGFSLFALIIIFKVLKKYINLKCAVIASLLFIFPPKLFTQSTLISWGAHTEAIALCFLNIFIFFEIFFSEKSYYFKEIKKSFLSIFSLGLSAGFSIYFAYINLYSVLLCVFFWFVLDRSFFLKRTFVIFICGFLIGFSPWIYYNLTHSFTGLNILKTYSPGSSRSISIFNKALKFFSSDIPLLFNFSKFNHMTIQRISLLCYFLVIAAFLTLVWKHRNSLKNIFKALIPLNRYSITPDEISKESFFLLAPVMFSIVFFFSNVSIGYSLDEPFLTFRYLTHLFPFIFIILAIFLSDGCKKSKSLNSLVKMLIFFLFLAIGLWGNMGIPSYHTKIKYSDLDGFSYWRLGWTIPKKFGFDFKKYIALGEKIDPHFRHQYYYGLGFSTGGRGIIWKKGFERFLPLNPLIEKMDELYKSYYYQGMGYNAGTDAIYNEYKKCITFINRIDIKYRNYAYMGMAMTIYENGQNDTDMLSIVKGIPLEHRKYFYPLLGKYIVGRKRGLANSVKFIKKLNLNPEDECEVYRGLGLNIYLNSYYTLDKLHKEAVFLSVKQKDALYEGIGVSIGVLYKRKAEKISECLKGSDTLDKKNIYRGIGRFIAEEYGFDLPLCSEFFKQLDKQFRADCYEGLQTQAIWRFGDNKGAISDLFKAESDNTKLLFKAA